MNHSLFLSKYRPYHFNDFEIDINIINLLNILIKLPIFNILLIGDMGCGKTALLNAIIKEYYVSFKYSQYEQNLLHINSLKEQGINYYRNDVKTFCQTCSCIHKYNKIIVLDDLDIINEQSQQVFRNSIDKYNNNVNFIASCTNSQKVIESLQSRMIIIKINSLNIDNLVHITQKIKHFENINMTDDAEKYMLTLCNNNAKILINYLEKCKLINELITLDIVSNTCTNINFIFFSEYTNYLKNKQLIEAIKLIYFIFDKGYSVMDIMDTYFKFIKTTNMISEKCKYDIIPLICKYITMFYNIHEDEIELALFTNNMYKLF